jgi:hypothetical protein
MGLLGLISIRESEALDYLLLVSLS